MGHLRLISGKPDQADKILKQALYLFPGYHYALGNLAKVRLQQKHYDEAVNLLQQRYQAAPHGSNRRNLFNRHRHVSSLPRQINPLMDCPHPKVLLKSLNMQNRRPTFETPPHLQS